MKLAIRSGKMVVATAIAATALTAFAAGPDFGPGMFGGMGGWGPSAGEGGPPQGGRHQHHFRGQGEHRGHGPMSQERMEERIDRMAYRLVRSVDGTPEQEIKIRGIARAAAKEVAELRKQGRDLRGKGLELLKAPTIDRNAIESLRGQQMALQDAISKRMSTAMADAAEVLTPEQRAKLAERASQRKRRG